MQSIQANVECLLLGQHCLKYGCNTLGHKLVSITSCRHSNWDLHLFTAIFLLLFRGISVPLRVMQEWAIIQIINSVFISLLVQVVKGDELSFPVSYWKAITQIDLLSISQSYYKGVTSQPNTLFTVGLPELLIDPVQILLTHPAPCSSLAELHAHKPWACCHHPKASCLSGVPGIP